MLQRLALHMSAAGSTGLSALLPIEHMAAPIRPGESAFVTGASGAVGSVAGQVLRIKGCGRVVGSAGTDAKVKLLTGSLRFDDAFNYRAVLQQAGVPKLMLAPISER